MLLPITFIAGGALHLPLLPAGAIPAPVQGYSVAFGRGRSPSNPQAQGFVGAVILVLAAG
jgi:hypothetical protein